MTLTRPERAAAISQARKTLKGFRKVPESACEACKHGRYWAFIGSHHCSADDARSFPGCVSDDLEPSFEAKT